MSKTYKKELTAVNVFDAAMERFNTLYDRYDNVVVSFSGGKDSTVCLQLALMVAMQRGKLPLDVVFFDEEAIHPTTIEYVERVAQMPGVRLHWYCIPVKHRNACSRQQPYWYCWNPAEKDLWVRDLPERAITQLSGFEFGMTMPDCAHFTVSPDSGMTAMVRGLRASESLRRYRSVSMKLEDNWIMRAVGGYCVPCSPMVISADVVHQKMSTIRHNRARGTHAVVKMADIVQSMVEEGVPADEIARRLGMEDEEVVRLANRNGIPISMLGKEFGQSWRPKE